jgi:photosystem II stability/assembly factor-like uncharacterized protein
VEGSADRAHRALVLIAVAAVALIVACVVYLRANPGGPARVPTSQPGFLLGAASFGDADHGSVTMLELGPDRPGPPKEYSSTWLTSNGGRTWQRLGASQAAPITVTFVGPTRAFALSPTVFRSTQDGGRTWRSLSSPFPLQDLVGSPVFADASHGWLLQEPGTPSSTLPVTGASDEGPVALWRTSDGGRAWQPAAASGIPSAGRKGPLVFVDSEHGVLAVTPVLPGPPALLVTTDGGDTWQTAQALDGGLASAPPWGMEVLGGAGSLFAVPQWIGSAYVTSDDGKAPIGGDVRSQSFVARSSDGGRTWSPLERAPVVTAPSFGAASPALDDRGRLVLFDARVLWTSADGVAWQAHPAALPAGLVPVGPLYAVRGALFEAASPRGRQQVSRLLRSRDGGIHWSRVPLPGDG